MRQNKERRRSPDVQRVSGRPATPLRDFFAHHAVFQSVDSSKFGVANLTSQLTKLLVSRIQQELVPMKHEVESSLQKVRSELRGMESYGNASTPAERQKLLVTLTQE